MNNSDFPKMQTGWLVLNKRCYRMKVGVPHSGKLHSHSANQELCPQLRLGWASCGPQHSDPAMLQVLLFQITV